MPERFRRDRSQRGHETQSDRKIEMRSFLGQIRRRKIDRDFFCRQRQTGGMERGLHPLPAFRHRLVRQADDLDADLSGCDHHLHLDRHTLYSLKCNRIDPCHHGLPPQTGHNIKALCPDGGHSQVTCHRAKNKTRTLSEQFRANGVFQLYRVVHAEQTQVARKLPQNSCASRFFSIASHNRLATSAPPNFCTSRMPVGEVTLISVR